MRGHMGRRVKGRREERERDDRGEGRGLRN